LRGYESESERRYMVEYEYAMYAPYHPDLTDVASLRLARTADDRQPRTWRVYHVV